MIGARWEISGGNRVPLTLATFPNARIPNETKTPHAAERKRRDFEKIAEIAKNDQYRGFVTLFDLT